MEIKASPPEPAVRKLLEACGLPTADLSACRMEDFFGCGPAAGLAGVVGLELLGEVALLRSLAVDASRRNTGLGSRLLAHAERYARERGVVSLYLLTTTAEDFFRRRGYQRLPRELAPPAIRNTAEFAGICPMSSAFMTRRLDGPV
jgi:amino-acid N-acetyltransferase